MPAEQVVVVSQPVINCCVVSADLPSPERGTHSPGRSLLDADAGGFNDNTKPWSGQQDINIKSY